MLESGAVHHKMPKRSVFVVSRLILTPPLDSWVILTALKHFYTKEHISHDDSSR